MKWIERQDGGDLNLTEQTQWRFQKDEDLDYLAIREFQVSLPLVEGVTRKDSPRFELWRSLGFMFCLSSSGIQFLLTRIECSQNNLSRIGNEV